MALPIPVTAVFDIGKTNKKFLLFDEHYRIVREEETMLEQAEDEDGDSCEDLETLEHWIKNKVRDTARETRVQIKSLNFSTYGASLVHLDNQGNAATPLYNYLKPYPEELFDKFYNTYGGKKKLSLQTASPPMGMLNSGFQLYWLKYKKPTTFREITTSLHFPQYLSYLFTGRCAAELTSIGCHTALWNFNTGQYHQWLKQEDVLKLLPPPQAVTHTFDAVIQGVSRKVGMGIHDSSAALTPYLFALEDPFMLVSTGTWSITFNPFNKEPLTYSELQKDCLCYLDIYGKQVKSSRLFLGSEYMHQKNKLDTYFDRPQGEADVSLDVELLQKLVREDTSGQRLELEQAYQSGPYPREKPGEWRLEGFASYEEAYHQLMLDLVAIQSASIKLAQGSDAIDTLIITGGFSGNEFYLNLLAAFFPDKKIFTSKLQNASALGAAMIMDHQTMKNRKKMTKELLGLTHHQPKEYLTVKGYSWKANVGT